MITKQRATISLIIYSFLFCLSVLLIRLLVTSIINDSNVIIYILLLSFFIFTCVFYFSGKISDFLFTFLHKKHLQSGLTHIISEFISKIKHTFSMDELVFSIQEILEKKGDSSVLLIDTEREYVIYNSPSIITNDEKVLSTLHRNFSYLKDDGYYFFNDELGLLSKSSNARGFFIVFNDLKLFVFCNATRMYARAVFRFLLEELKNFYLRYATLARLSDIDELSQEWVMVAETQKSFLPSVLPNVANLDIDVYFKPLVNVSGDYYSIIPLTEKRTLVILGDVSGKGFSAALIMGIVINIVKMYAHTLQLSDLVLKIDKTIKSMQFEDKYTVLFAGIIDTQDMELSYINASMDDIRILTQTPGEYNIKKLPSTCGIVGLVDMNTITIETVPLFWEDVIFLATDGISETKNSEGVELGYSSQFSTVLKTSAHKDAQHFIEDVRSLISDFANDNTVRDDLTICVLKVKRNGN